MSTDAESGATFTATAFAGPWLPTRGALLAPALTLATWVAVSNAFNVSSKLVAGGSDARNPTVWFATTATQLAFATGVGAALTRARHPRARFRAYAAGPLRRAVPIGGALALANGAMMFALSHTSVSMFQTVKASGPLFTAAACYLVLRRRYTPETYAALVPIMLGLMMATLSDLEGDALGFAACVVSSLAQVFINLSAKTVFELKWAGLEGGDLLGEEARPIDAVELQMLVSLVGTCVTTYAFLIFYVTNAWGRPAAALALNVLLYAAENVCAYATNAQFTRLPFAVSDAARRLSIVLASLLMVGRTPTLVNVFGVLLVAGGSVQFAKVVREVGSS